MSNSDAEHWQLLQERLAEMEFRQQQAQAGGGAQRLAKQHQQGKLSARERLVVLLDADSFVEIGALVRHQNTGLMAGVDAPCEGVVTGFGQIDGRQVFVFSQDFTVLGGSLGKMHAQKIAHMMDLAAQTGCPIIGLNDSAGARIQEGVDALSGYGEIFYRNARYSGCVPQISAILGPCAGGAVYSPALTDVILMSEQSYMFITGPEVIKAVTHEDVGFAELGGAQVHAKKSGVAHWIGADDRAVLLKIREMLAFFPQHAQAKPPLRPSSDPINRACPELSDIVEPNQRKTYAVSEIIRSVVDDGRWCELQPQWARSLQIGWAHLGGQVVGIVANNPKYLAGALTSEAATKAARFIRTCDCFNIPIITLVDVSGFLPGVAQEHAGIIRHGAKMLYAYAEATVPKITLMLRKAYGGAYLAMNSKDMGADVVLAWPTAAVAVMGAEGAASVVYRQEIANSADPSATRAQKVRAYQTMFDHPYIAAERGYIDDVIAPETTRSTLIRYLRMLDNKTEHLPHKKHGNMPL